MNKNESRLIIPEDKTIPIYLNDENSKDIDFLGLAGDGYTVICNFLNHDTGEMEFFTLSSPFDKDDERNEFMKNLDND